MLKVLVLMTIYCLLMSYIFYILCPVYIIYLLLLMHDLCGDIIMWLKYIFKICNCFFGLDKTDWWMDMVIHITTTPPPSKIGDWHSMPPLMIKSNRSLNKTWYELKNNCSHKVHDRIQSKVFNVMSHITCWYSTLWFII